MEKQMIKISKKEYEGMKETIEVLQNPDIMGQILESEKNVKEGDHAGSKSCAGFVVNL